MASKIEETIWKIAEPIANELGLEIYDVEFKKEGSDYFLRVYIDREDTGIFIEDCEAVSRPLSDALDEIDPIQEAYYLEVSSPGLERQLKRQKDFDRFNGERISVKLFKALNDVKKLEGKLISRNEEMLEMEIDSGEIIKINNKDIAIVRLAITF